MEISEPFFYFLVSTGVSALLLISRMIYKSRCGEVKLCCLYIKRTPEDVEEQRELASRNSISLSPTSNNLVEMPTIYPNSSV
jgi:hypothetical protein